jgi:hypothetical protein
MPAHLVVLCPGKQNLHLGLGLPNRRGVLQNVVALRLAHSRGGKGRKEAATRHLAEQTVDVRRLDDG